MYSLYYDGFFEPRNNLQFELQFERCLYTPSKHQITCWLILFCCKNQIEKESWGISRQKRRSSKVWHHVQGYGSVRYHQTRMHGASLQELSRVPCSREIHQEQIYSINWQATVSSIGWRSA